MDEMNDVTTAQLAPPRPFILLSEACAAARRCEAEALFHAVEKALGELVGHKFFAVCYLNPETREVVGMYTSRPTAYPPGVVHPAATDDWIDLVITRGQPYIGSDESDLLWAFPQHEQIGELGCASMLNVPVVVKGETVGMVTLMHNEGWYRDAHVQIAMPFAYLLVPAFSAARQLLEA